MHVSVLTLLSYNGLTKFVRGVPDTLFLFIFLYKKWPEKMSLTETGRGEEEEEEG